MEAVLKRIGLACLKWPNFRTVKKVINKLVSQAIHQAFAGQSQNTQRMRNDYGGRGGQQGHVPSRRVSIHTEFFSKKPDFFAKP